MSGIVGYINRTGKAESVLLDSMSESIRHIASRPIDKWHDDFLAIAHLDHAITNPQPQPIFNEDKSMLIVMLGEVFDYEEQKLELIRNGHKFKSTDNDAEYCLRLYEEKGELAFKELNGSFCIAIYNLATHEFLLVNDRFSSHPLFYYLTDNKTLLFGTQLSSMLRSSDVARELNMRAIFEFFTFQRVFATRTFYKDINLLPPATVLHYRDGSTRFSTYWEMIYKHESHPQNYYVHELAIAIKNSVERRTQGNHRFGLLLSGGLDSRMILAASDNKMVCFTFGDFENREFRIAKGISRVKGCKHIFLKRNTDHYVNLVDDAVDIGDGMFSFFHAHSLGFFEQIRSKCDVLLHGYAPELFFRGTNLPHRDLKFLGKSFLTVPDRLSNERLPHKIIDKLKYSLHHKNPQQLFVKPHASILDSVLLDSVNTILKEAEPNCTNIYDKFMWLDTHYQSRYPSFLFETSMRSFINERSIVFDNDLICLHSRMPVDLRSNSRIWKKVLMELNPQIAEIPDANTGYSPFMPEFLASGLNVGREIANKLHLLKAPVLPHPMYTQGSWPGANMIRYNEKMIKLIDDTLIDTNCFDPDIFNIQRIKEIFKEYLNGKDEYIVFLFLLLTFGKWHKKYGPKSLQRNPRI